MKLKIAEKISLLSVLLVILTAGTVAFSFYKGASSMLLEHALEDLSLKASLESVRFSTHIEAMREDVHFISNTPPISGLIRARRGGGVDLQMNSTHSDWVGRLQTIFQAYLEEKSEYIQLRFIDASGKEWVRVEKRDGVIKSVPEEELQDKSESVYIRETLGLAKGRVYLSEINLNREYGVVMEPYTPVLRAATPVYDEDNKVAGLVVINMDIGLEFDRIRGAYADSNQVLYITNDRGDYLAHPDAGKTYGFDLGHQYRVQEDFPRVSQLFFSGSKKKKITLLPEKGYSDLAVVYYKVPFDPDMPDRFIAIGLSERYEDITANVLLLMSQELRWSILLVILGAIFAFGFSQLITRPLKQIVIGIDEFRNSRIRSNLPVKRTDELGQVARSFDDLSKEVEETHGSLRALNENLENIVEERTRNLQESVIRHQTVLETMVDALITINEKGMIESFNSAAERIFGYKASEVKGKNINILMPEPYHSEHDGYLRNYHKTGKANIIGKGREVEAMRKDGSVFPIDLSVSEMILDGCKIYSGIVRDITERKRVDKMKNEFVSTVSHELRTPLTSIRGSLGLIAGGAAGDLSDQAKSLLEIASNNTERLLLLINDILDIQKIESGVMRFRYENVLVMPLIEQAIDNNASYGNEYGVSFEITQRLAGCKVYADPDRLMQVLNNLLSNAAKFSPAGEVVELAVARHNDAIRISVTDHGPGIPDSFKEKLFERFTQSDSTDTRKSGGTGLGLNITRIIVEKHGGRISFISKEGIGATFFVDLPEVVGEVVATDSDFPRQLGKNYKACILIVEDDPDVAALLMRMLAESGFNSDIAYNASEARRLLKENAGQYIAMTLDIMLPDEDGISLLRDLRSHDEVKGLPVIVVSVKADEAKRKLTGSAIEVRDWLSKPIDQDRLISIIENIAGLNQKPKVLHVEDEQDVRKIVAMMLKDKVELSSAASLESSRQILQQKSFDLVLLDIGLPDGSGLDLISEIKQCDPQPKIVIFSAQDVSLSDLENVDRALVKSKTSNEDLLNTFKSLLPVV